MSDTTFLCWNIAGLTRAKRTHPCLLSLFQHHDVVVLTETHLADDDHYSPAGYTPYHCHAPLSNGRAPPKTGGVTVLVRRAAGITVEHVTHPFSIPCVCLRLTSPTLTPSPLLLAAVYVPHSTSPLAVADPFASLAEDLFTVASPHDQVLLAGDMNAHIGSLSDLLTLGRGAELVLGDAAQALQTHDYSCIPHARGTRGPVGPSGHDARGQSLIHSLCHSLGYVILNGRAPGDEHGVCTRPTAATCTDQPQILDMYLSTPALFPCIRSLTVRTDPHSLSTLSDHWPVSLTLAAPPPPPSPAPAPPGRRAAKRAGRRGAPKPRQRPRFDTDRWGVYARCVSDPATLATVHALEAELQAGIIDI